MRWLKRGYNWVTGVGNIVGLWTLGGSAVITGLTAGLLLLTNFPVWVVVIISLGVALLTIAAALTFLPRAFNRRRSVDQRSSPDFTAPVITERVILVPEFARLGEDVIADKTFVRCVFEGPAVVAIAGPNRNNTMTNPIFEAAEPPAGEHAMEQLLISGSGSLKQGVVWFRDVHMIDCRFRGISFYGSAEWVESQKNYYNNFIQIHGHPLMSHPTNDWNKRRRRGSS